jgi:hypothetical protein
MNATPPWLQRHMFPPQFSAIRVNLSGTEIAVSRAGGFPE